MGSDFLRRGITETKGVRDRLQISSSQYLLISSLKSTKFSLHLSLSLIQPLLNSSRCDPGRRQQIN